jgi:hypothetical protein
MEPKKSVQNAEKMHFERSLFVMFSLRCLGRAAAAHDAVDGGNDHITRNGKAHAIDGRPAGGLPRQFH